MGMDGEKVPAFELGWKRYWAFIELYEHSGCLFVGISVGIETKAFDKGSHGFMFHEDIAEIR